MLVTINCLDSLAGRLPPSTHCARLLKNAGDMVELAKRDHWQALESWSWGSLPYLEARCSRMAPLSNSFRSPGEVDGSRNNAYGAGATGQHAGGSASVVTSSTRQPCECVHPCIMLFMQHHEARAHDSPQAGNRTDHPPSPAPCPMG